MHARSHPSYAPTITAGSLLRLVILGAAVLTVATAVATCASSSDRDGLPSDVIIKRLANARYVATDFATLAGAIDEVYEQPVSAPSPLGKLAQRENLYACQTGRRSEGLAYVDSNRQMGCLALVVNLIELYRLTESEAAYRAGVHAANYYLTEYPKERRKFNELIAARLHDSLPIQ